MDNDIDRKILSNLGINDENVSMPDFDVFDTSITYSNINHIIPTFFAIETQKPSLCDQITTNVPELSIPAAQL